MAQIYGDTLYNADGYWLSNEEYLDGVSSAINSVSGHIESNMTMSGVGHTTLAVLGNILSTLELNANSYIRAICSGSFSSKALILKPKLSSLVSSQLPEFIQEDYATFVTFLEAYYEYLEGGIISSNDCIIGTKYTINILGTTNFTLIGASSNTLGLEFIATGKGTGTGSVRTPVVIIDFTNLSDIDTTLDSFIKYFKNEVALNFPTTLVDDRFLLPRLKELYISKGTEASYKLLFKILYNKDIDIKYPATQMLRTSDGKWSQPISIFVLITNGSPDDIVGKAIEIISTIKITLMKINVFIDRYESTDSANVYEFFLLSSFTGSFNIGDLVNYSNTFNGTIAATTTSLSVIQSGKNFKIGQNYEVSSGGGSGSIITVDSIDINGGIKVARFVNFGINYSNSFTANILASANNISIVQSFFTIGGTSPSFNVTVTDIVDQTSDEGSISLYNYASTIGDGTYVEASYAGTILTTFSNKSANVVIDSSDYAIIGVGLGSIARYPGYYKNTDGFLDDNIYIQDSKYYQAFSYAIEIDERFDSYKSIVKNLIHPSGTEIFGEYTITNELNMNIGIGLTILDYVFNLVDENSNQFITESGDVIQVII